MIGSRGVYLWTILHIETPANRILEIPHCESLPTFRIFWAERL